MRSRLLLNLVLVVVVAVLGAIAFFEPALDEDGGPVAITALEVNDIATLRVERSNGSAVAFARRDGVWWMVEPVEAVASDYRVQSVLNIARADSLARYDVAEADLAKLGLEPPELRVIYNGDTVIAFGAQAPMDQRRYVRIGDEVHLVSGSGYYHLVGHYPTFVDTALLPPGARITALHLPGLDLVQREQAWTVSPQPVDFSMDAVNVLLEHWRHTRALDVTRHQPRRSRGSVRVALADGGEITFAIMAREPELVLARPELGLEYRLTAESAERLFTLPATPSP
ncbi:MAG: DUF4340 domain-containing protein [Thiohalomonadaceae bacterium]